MEARGLYFPHSTFVLENRGHLRRLYLCRQVSLPDIARRAVYKYETNT